MYDQKKEKHKYKGFCHFSSENNVFKDDKLSK